MYTYYLCSCVPGICGGQKKAQDSLGTGLRMVVNRHVDAKNLGSLKEQVSALNHSSAVPIF